MSYSVAQYKPLHLNRKKDLCSKERVALWTLKITIILIFIKEIGDKNITVFLGWDWLQVVLYMLIPITFTFCVLQLQRYPMPAETKLIAVWLLWACTTAIVFHGQYYNYSFYVIPNYFRGIAICVMLFIAIRGIRLQNIVRQIFRYLFIGGILFLVITFLCSGGDIL